MGRGVFNKELDVVRGGEERIGEGLEVDHEFYHGRNRSIREFSHGRRSTSSTVTTSGTSKE